MTQEVADAAAQGDRSENAEYIYGKRRLREIDRRVRFLSKRLDEITVVNEPPSDPRRVFFSAYVTVEDEDGAEKTYRIVGADESDLDQGCISIDSPVGARAGRQARRRRGHRARAARRRHLFGRRRALRRAARVACPAPGPQPAAPADARHPWRPGSGRARAGARRAVARDPGRAAQGAAAVRAVAGPLALRLRDHRAARRQADVPGDARRARRGEAVDLPRDVHPRRRSHRRPVQGRAPRARAPASRSA